jgi:PAS domain S-box-containing protein
MFTGVCNAILLLLAPAIVYGVVAAALASIGLGVGTVNVPLLPSGIALCFLLAFGWRAFPGIAAGAWGAGLWCVLSGESASGLGPLAWLLLLPVGACAQAAVAYALARRVAPNLFDSPSPGELARFLLTTGPLGSAVGAIFACAAAAPVSKLPLPFILMSGAGWWLIDIFAGLAVVALVHGFLGRAPRPFLMLAMVGSTAGTLLGAAVIFGWLTHDTVLIQVAPELTPMQFNTALCFVFSGIGLLLLIHGRPRLAGAVGGLPCTIGLLTLSQYIFAFNLGIDQFILTHYVTVNTTFAGRMAPSTAMCFILFGAALTQSGRTTRGSHVAASTLYSIAASAGMITLLSYAVGLDGAYVWAQLTPMALHTAIGFVVLGLAGLAREVVQAEGATRRVSLSPIPTGVALAAMSIWLWQAVYRDEEEKIRRLALERASDLARLIDMEITYHNNTMARMANRWAFSGAYSKEEWTHLAKQVLRDFPSIAALSWADAESRVQWLEPLAGNEDIIGNPLSAHAEGARVLQRIKETGRQGSTSIITMKPIGKGFIIFTPIIIDGVIDSYILGLYRIDKLFEVLPPNSMSSYMFRVYESDKLVYASDPEANWPENPENAVQIEQNLRDGLWKLELVPQPEWLQHQRSNLPLMILLAGLFLSAATTVTLLLLEAVRAQYAVIKLSEDRLRQLVDCAPTGLITTNENGQILDVNPEAERQFGYTLDELRGRPVEVLLPGHVRESHIRDRQKYISEPATRPMGKGRNLIALKKNGHTFPVEVALAPFRTRNAVQVLALVTDITERDEARRKLEAHTKALELINKDLDDFAYVASHDLRAPLTAIGSLVLWLEEDTANLLPEASANHLGLIKNRVARMGKLLEDLLDYSRAGRTANSMETVDTEEMVAQVVDLVRGTMPLTINTKGLPVFATVRTPLQQILRNLISNAIKHHDRDSCTIEVTVEESGPFYVFRVSDDGPGIPSQFHDKIFNMFQTLRPRDEVEGSGMGLALVRKLVERYGGIVYVVDTPGRGTTIEFTWPKTITGG